MELRKRVILVFLAMCLFLIALRLSVDFPTGLGIYYGNTSATNPEGVIRFKVAQMIVVVLISPPDNTIFTIPGATLNVSLTCRVSNLTPANITQVKLYTDIFGPFGVTQVVNVTGPPPHTVTFNVSNVPLGTYQWNCEGITSNGLHAFAPDNWHFTIRTTPPPPTPGGGGGGGWIPPPIVEVAGYPLPCVLPPDGLKSWWTFDASTDDFWNESNKGTPANQPRFEKRENDLAITLDGKGDYVVIAPANAYDLFAEGTIDGWVEYKNKDDFATIFSYSDPERAEADAKHLKLGITSWGSIEFEYRNGIDYRVIEPDANFNFKRQDKKWVHVALSYEDEAYTWYINGVKYSSKTIALGGKPGFWFNDLSDGNELVGIIGAGLSSPQPANFFRGAVDELEIYDRPLDYLEVNAIYSRSKCKIQPPKITPPLTEEEIAEEIAKEAEKVLEKPKLYQPELITPIPWWLLILALLGIAAVLLAYYKGVMSRHKKAEPAKSVRKKKKR